MVGVGVFAENVRIRMYTAAPNGKFPLAQGIELNHLQIGLRNNGFFA